VERPTRPVPGGGEVKSRWGGDQLAGAVADTGARRARGRGLVTSEIDVSAGDFLAASIRRDRTVRLWDPATGRPAGAPLTGHTSTANAVAFSPDGTVLASASADNTVRLWDSDLFDPLVTLCTRFGPPTPEEWDHYAPDEPLPAVCP
jgi:WD40 repeat protein